MKFISKHNNFIPVKELKNAFCKMAAILLQPQCVFEILKRKFVHWYLGSVSLMFYELSKIFSGNLILQKSYVLLEFQAETLYACPKLCFAHTYKVSAWNFHHKCDFWHCIYSWDYFGELAKCLWNNSLDPWWLTATQISSQILSK